VSFVFVEITPFSTADHHFTIVVCLPCHTSAVCTVSYQTVGNRFGAISFNRKQVCCRTRNNALPELKSVKNFTDMRSNVKEY
jgi:hypothetical protein